MLIVPPVEEAEPQGEAIPLENRLPRTLISSLSTKPAGLVVHPAPGHATGTLVNALIAPLRRGSLSGIGGGQAAGHRAPARQGHVRPPGDRQDGCGPSRPSPRSSPTTAAPWGLTRTYVAFVWGKPERVFGTIEAAISAGTTPTGCAWPWCRRRARSHGDHALASRGPNSGRRRAASRATSRPGRTHQIRVHMAHIGHPVLGRSALTPRGFSPRRASSRRPRARLWSASIGRRCMPPCSASPHPVTGEDMLFESPLPADLVALEAALARG